MYTIDKLLLTDLVILTLLPGLQEGSERRVRAMKALCEERADREHHVLVGAAAGSEDEQKLRIADELIVLLVKARETLGDNQVWGKQWGANNWVLQKKNNGVRQ